MIRWKAISLFVLSVALLSTSCAFLAGDADEDKNRIAPSEQAALDQIGAGATDDGEASEGATADDDETAPPPVDDGETETESESPPVTEGPKPQVFSEKLQVCSIDNIEDNGDGVYVVTFVGDCQEASSGYHDFRVRIEATDGEWLTSSDSGNRELCSYRAISDEVLVRCDGFNRANSVDGSIDGVPFAAVAEFTGNEMTFTTDSALSNGNVSGLVSIIASDGSEKEVQSYP